MRSIVVMKYAAKHLNSAHNVISVSLKCIVPIDLLSLLTGKFAKQLTSLHINFKIRPAYHSFDNNLKYLLLIMHCFYSKLFYWLSTKLLPRGLDTKGCDIGIIELSNVKWRLLIGNSISRGRESKKGRNWRQLILYAPICLILPWINITWWDSSVFSFVAVQCYAGFCNLIGNLIGYCLKQTVCWRFFSKQYIFYFPLR